jgi:hypothetical protein
VKPLGAKMSTFVDMNREPVNFWMTCAYQMEGSNQTIMIGERQHTLEADADEQEIAEACAFWA